MQKLQLSQFQIIRSQLSKSLITDNMLLFLKCTANEKQETPSLTKIQCKDFSNYKNTLNDIYSHVCKEDERRNFTERIISSVVENAKGILQQLKRKFTFVISKKVIA